MGLLDVDICGPSIPRMVNENSFSFLRLNNLSILFSWDWKDTKFTKAHQVAGSVSSVVLTTVVTIFNNFILQDGRLSMLRIISRSCR